MVDQDKREYFRIDDHLEIEYRRVDPSEFERLKNIIRYNPSYASDIAQGMRFMGDGAVQKRGEEKEIISYLRVLERKLDMILELLGQQQSKHVYKSITDRISISGAGVRFTSDEPLVVNEQIELRFGLPIAPFPKVSTLCEVVRIEESIEQDAKVWHIAVKFLVLNDFDRDVLINYIFTKEREKLRSEKETG